MIRRFARPYARAIMDVAGSPQAASALRGELMGFESALRKSPELRELFANPAIDLASKQNVARTIASKLKAGDQAKKIVEVLVSNHRINDLGAILEAVSAYVNTALGVAVAEVRSAKSLSPDEMQRLADVLSKKVGKAVELDVRTDPKLLGGIIVKIGSEIWDASVAGKINKFRESLT
jgi:F-type H+-transporting ATPase subunit delta